MEILRGADVVAAMNKEMMEDLKSFQEYMPSLAIIRVGERPDDISYEKGATKRLVDIGIRCSSFVFPETITMKEFEEEFLKINNDLDTDGILLLRPLPKQLDEKKIEQLITPRKDVDGISPMNLAKVFSGDDTGYAPCTAEAVMEMLEFAKIDLTGKKVAIVGRSLVVGKPLAMLMLKKNATVTICHTKTINMEAVCSDADIVIAAAGKAKMLHKDFVKRDAIVIDVGINVDSDGKLCGDVDFEDISERASLATPVPGGVGTVTTSVLAKHVIKAADFKR